MSFEVSQLNGFNAGMDYFDQTLSPLSTQAINTSQTTFDFTSLDFGPERSDRMLIGLFYVARSGAPTISGTPTIGGVSATTISSVGSNVTVALCYANVPTGNSGTFSVTVSASSPRATCALFSAYNLKSNTASSTNAPAGGAEASRSVTLTIPASGIAVVVMGGDDITPTWTNATQSLNLATSFGDGVSTGINLPDALQTSLVITAANCRAICGAAWG